MAESQELPLFKHHPSAYDERMPQDAMLPPPETVVQDVCTTSEGPPEWSSIGRGEELDLLIETARKAGITQQAINSMCDHDDPFRLITRALRRIGKPQIAYSRAVALTMQGDSSPSHKEYVEYARNGGYITYPRYMVKKWLEGRDFDSFMEEAAKRAESIVRPPKGGKHRTNPLARQAERNLLAAQQLQAQAPATSRPPSKVEAPGGHMLAKLVKPDQLEALRAQYLTAHTGFIAMLDHTYLAETIVDFSPFPAAQEPYEDPAIPLLITGKNRIAVDGEDVQLDERQRKILNILILLKGQSVLVKEIAHTGLSVQEIYQSGADLCRKLNSDKSKQDRSFYPLSVWNEQALQASPRLSILDVRKGLQPRHIFKWDR